MGQKYSESYYKAAEIDYQISKAGLVPSGIEQSGNQKRYPALLYEDAVWQGKELALDFGKPVVKIMQQQIVYDPKLGKQQTIQTWLYNSIQVVAPSKLKLTAIHRGSGRVSVPVRKDAIITMLTDTINLQQYIANNNPLQTALGLLNNQSAYTELSIQVVYPK